MEARRDMMLARPDRVETQGAGEPYLLERLGEPTLSIIARRMLRVEINAELHV
jgi:hypothetical protein